MPPESPQEPTESEREAYRQQLDDLTHDVLLRGFEPLMKDLATSGVPIDVSIRATWLALSSLLASRSLLDGTREAGIVQMVDALRTPIIDEACKVVSAQLRRAAFGETVQ